MLQGIGNLRAHNYEYWNSSHKFIFYPETQITCGIILMIFAILPLRRMFERLTTPFFNSRHPKLKSFWKRRHHESSEPRSDH